MSSHGPSAWEYSDDNPSTSESDLPLTIAGANDAAAPVNKRFLMKLRRDDIVDFVTDHFSFATADSLCPVA